VFGSNNDREHMKHNIKHEVCVRKVTLISENKRMQTRVLEVSTG
jgi:hypothetical protein